MTNITTLKDTNLNIVPLTSNLQTLVGFGGLSESGKSSHADFLRQNHGFYRLKLKYFISNLERAGIDPEPGAVAMEVLRFINAHPYTSRFSLESHHGPYIPSALKSLFGPKFQLVFMDTPRETRIRRCAAQTGLTYAQATNHVTAKDREKFEAGSLAVHAMADIVWANGDNGAPDSASRLADVLMSDI